MTAGSARGEGTCAAPVCAAGTCTDAGDRRSGPPGGRDSHGKCSPEQKLRIALSGLRDYFVFSTTPPPKKKIQNSERIMLVFFYVYSPWCGFTHL